jgi:hypothetical protein
MVLRKVYDAPWKLVSQDLANILTYSQVVQIFGKV